MALLESPLLNNIAMVITVVIVICILIAVLAYGSQQGPIYNFIIILGVTGLSWFLTYGLFSHLWGSDAGFYLSILGTAVFILGSKFLIKKWKKL